MGRKGISDRTVCVKAQRCESKRANSLVELKRIGVKLGRSQRKGGEVLRVLRFGFCFKGSGHRVKVVELQGECSDL